MKSSLLIGLMLIQFVCFAQKGYMGKRSMISVDVLNAIALKKIGLEYRLCLGTHSSMALEYSSQQTTTSALNQHVNADLNYNNKSSIKAPYSFNGSNYLYNGKEFYNSTLINSTSIERLKNFSVSFLFGGSYTDMPHPLGYYWGLGFNRFWGNIDTKASIDLYTNSGSSYNYYSNNDVTRVTETVKYKVAGTVAKIIVGRTWYLVKNFTLDFNLSTGVFTSHANSDPDNIFTITPTRLYPRSFIYTNSYLEQMDTGIINEFSSVGIMFLPKLSVGYIF